MSNNAVVMVTAGSFPNQKPFPTATSIKTISRTRVNVSSEVST
jgi:hypothetical protein